VILVLVFVFENESTGLADGKFMAVGTVANDAFAMIQVVRTIDEVEWRWSGGIVMALADKPTSQVF
jgi:hypothetical protein